MVNKPTADKGQRFCPYCDEEKVAADQPCTACGVTVFYCPRCRKPVERSLRKCPHCGAAIKGEKT